MTEAELCDRIRAWAEAAGFEVYPELQAWDLVLVAKMDLSLDRFDVRMGEQVGVHAKLRANCEVLAQALPPAWEGIGHPDYAVVAAPKAGQGFLQVAGHLGIGVLVTGYGGTIGFEERPRRVVGRKPLPLPSFASRAIRAGTPSPRQLSKWREAALTFLRWARANDGQIGLADLKRHGIARNWAQAWLTSTGERAGGGRTFLYRLTANPRALPDHGYEDVYAELCAALGPIPAAAPDRPATGPARSQEAIPGVIREPA